MKKSLKILSLVALISLTGCGDNENVNSSLNTSELDTVITENVDATKAKLENVLKGEKVGVKASTSVRENMNIVINGQPLSNASMSENINLVGNIDMKAGKEYYDEYLTRSYDEYGRPTLNTAKISEIVAKDTSSYYISMNSSMTEAGQSYNESEEAWIYPSTLSIKQNNVMVEEGEHDGSTNYMFYEYTLMAQEVLEEMGDTNAPLPEEYQLIIDFFEGKATSEQVLPVFIALYSMYTGEEVEFEDQYERQLVIDTLNEVQKINFASLYVASTDEVDGELVLTVKLDKAAIQANLVTFVNTFKVNYTKNAQLAGAPNDVIAEVTAVFDLIASDITNNMPSTFDVHSTVSFKDGIVTSTEEVVNVSGNIPQIGLMMLGLEPSRITGACTYSISMETSANVEFGNSYYSLPNKN